jgi:hypothetical protein
MWEEIQYQYHQLIHNIKRSVYDIKYFFIYGWKLRKQREWDYVFLFEMLLFKLKRMKDYFDNHGVAERSKQEEQALNLAISLCDRLVNRDDLAYAKHFSKRLDEKWGEYVLKDTGKDFKFTRSRLTMGREDEYNSDLRKLYKLSDKIMERDRKLMFNIISKYSLYWWD